MAGRKPIPEHLKLLKGTSRSDRRKKTPAVSANLPRPPRGLSKEAKRYFRILAKRLEDMRVASSSHTEMLALAASRLAEVDEYTRILEETGVTYETVGTMGQLMIKARPEVSLRSQAARHAQSLLAEFGLSPSAVNKVSARLDGDQANPFSKVSGQ